MSHKKANTGTNIWYQPPPEKKWHEGKTKADIDAETKAKVVNYRSIMGELMEKNKGVAAAEVVRCVLNYYRKFRLEVMPRIESGEYKDDVCFNFTECINVLGVRHTGSYPMRAYYAGFGDREYTLAQFEHVVQKWGDLNIGYSVRRVRAGDGEPVADSADVLAAKAELARLDEERDNFDMKKGLGAIKELLDGFCSTSGDMTVKEFVDEHLEKFIIESIMKVKLEHDIIPGAGCSADRIRSEMASMVDTPNLTYTKTERDRLRDIIDSAPKPVPVWRYVMQLRFATRENDISISAYTPLLDSVVADLEGRGFVVGRKDPTGAAAVGDRIKCDWGHSHETKEYWGVPSSDTNGSDMYLYVDLQGCLERL